MGYRTEHLRQDEVIITVSALQEYRRKAAAHDSYLRAARVMGGELTRRAIMAREARLDTEKSYHLGWIDCLRTFDQAVLDLMAQGLEAHPHLDDNPRRVRKGQTCLVNEPGCRCLLVERGA